MHFAFKNTEMIEGSSRTAWQESATIISFGKTPLGYNIAVQKVLMALKYNLLLVV
jgi:hypothetical protein